MRLLVISLIFSLFAWPAFANQVKQSSFEIPALTSPVIDQVGILSTDGRVKTESLIRQLRDSGGSQLAVLIVSSLHGLTIEEASIKVVDNWKLGSKDKDDGILLLVAPNERRMRIEVGQGKEGDLPDALARRIISEIIGPQFRAGRYDAGILFGVAAIIQKTDPQFDLDKVGVPRSSSHVRSGKSSGGFNVFPFIILIFVLGRILQGLRAGPRTPFNTRVSRGRGFYSGYSGSSWGSGGWGGGSGGGFSGGGGGFSGGGSSGSW